MITACSVKLCAHCSVIQQDSPDEPVCPLTIPKTFKSVSLRCWVTQHIIFAHASLTPLSDCCTKMCVCVCVCTCTFSHPGQPLQNASGTEQKAAQRQTQAVRGVAFQHATVTISPAMWIWLSFYVHGPNPTGKEQVLSSWLTFTRRTTLHSVPCSLLFTQRLH